MAGNLEKEKADSLKLLQNNIEMVVSPTVREKIKEKKEIVMANPAQMELA